MFDLSRIILLIVKQEVLRSRISDQMIFTTKFVYNDYSLNLTHRCDFPPYFFLFVLKETAAPKKRALESNGTDAGAPASKQAKEENGS